MTERTAGGTRRTAKPPFDFVGREALPGDSGNPSKRRPRAATNSRAGSKLGSGTGAEFPLASTRFSHRVSRVAVRRFDDGQMRSLRRSWVFSSGALSPPSALGSSVGPRPFAQRCRLPAPCGEWISDSFSRGSEGLCRLLRRTPLNAGERKIGPARRPRPNPPEAPEPWAKALERRAHDRLDCGTGTDTTGTAP